MAKNDEYAFVTTVCSSLFTVDTVVKVVCSDSFLAGFSCVYHSTMRLKTHMLKETKRILFSRQKEQWP